MVAVTQPHFALMDVPLLRNAAARSGDRVEVNLSTPAERKVSGIKLVLSGQADIGASTLTTLSGDVPILGGVDLVGLVSGIAN